MEDYQVILDKLTALDSKIDEVNKNVEVKPVFAGSTANEVNEVENRNAKFNKALRDVVNGRINRITIDKAVNAEGTDNTGGYLVPIEYGDELISTINQYGIARKYCTIKKMTRDKMNFPTVSTDIIAYNPSEGAQITASNYVFGQVQLDTTKYACIVPITQELVQDSQYNLQSEVIKSSAIGFANKEDSLLIASLTSVTNSVTAGVISTALTGSVGYGKLVDVVATLEASNINYLNNAVWLMSPTTKAAVRKLADTTGQPLINVNGQVGYSETLFGYPIVTSNLMPTASATSGKGAMYFGNLQNAYFGDRQTMDIYMGREGTVGSDNLLEKDMVAYRTTERVDIKVARPDAFVKVVVT